MTRGSCAWWSRSAPLVVTLVLCCGEADTAVRLVLAPDPNLNSPAQLLARVRNLQVVVDAEGGVRGVDTAGPTAGGGDALDWDDDGDLEVVFTSRLDSRHELPVLELGVSSNAGRDLQFTLLGFGGDVAMTAAATLAVGATAGLCARGEICRLGAPFNLLARARPPAVIWALPPPGVRVPPSVAYLSVLLSTTIVPESVPGHVSLIGGSGDTAGLSIEVEEALLLDPSTGAQERRSFLKLAPDTSLIEQFYTLTVGPGLVGENGLSFDQAPATAGDNPFISQLETTGVGGPPPGGCPEGFAYDPRADGCAPLLDCEVWGCPAGFVCGSDLPACIEDCRPFGACARPDARCDAETGVCRP